MENRMTEFSALLGDLVEQAQISGNVLDVNFIKDFFSDLELGEKECYLSFIIQVMPTKSLKALKEP